MKKIIAFLLSVIMLLSLVACDQQEKVEKDEKTVYVLSKVTVDANGAQTVMDFDYDKSGRILELKGLSGKEIMMHQTFEYDDEENTVVMIQLGTDGEEISRVTAKRNSNGKNTEQVTVTNGVTTRSVNEFDANGNITKTVTYNEADEQTGSTEYEYDDAGNRICERHIDSIGTEYSSREYQYDENGNIVENKYIVSGNVMLSYTYKYENGKLVERSAGNLVYKFTCDSAGRVKEFQVEQDGEAQGSVKFSYKKMTLTEKQAKEAEEYMESFMEQFLLA
jgi:YD repeat-containing protein